MRIRIKLRTTNQSLSINYRTLIQGLIYQAIGNNPFSSTLHDQGNRLENRPFKLFVFSDIYGHTRYDNRTHLLHFSSDSYFEVSSFNDRLIFRLSEFLDQNDYIVLGKKVISLVGYDIINDLVTVEELMTFNTMSPVIVNKTVGKKPMYLDPNTDEYKELLKNNIIKKFLLCYGYNPQDFEIHNIENIKRIKIYFRRVFYIGYKYKITFKDLNQDLMKVLMRTGIGSKNSMGFGMLIDEKKDIFI